LITPVMVSPYGCHREKNLEESIADTAKINVVESSSNLSHDSNHPEENNQFGLVSTKLALRQRLYVT
jgi:hypothetical protein